MVAKAWVICKCPSNCSETIELLKHDLMFWALDQKWTTLAILNKLIVNIANCHPTSH